MDWYQFLRDALVNASREARFFKLWYVGGYTSRFIIPPRKELVDAKSRGVREDKSSS